MDTIRAFMEIHPVLCVICALLLFTIGLMVDFLRMNPPPREESSYETFEKFYGPDRRL